MSHKGFSNPQLLMTPDELRGRLDNPAFCIVDVRPTHAYTQSHIPGAVHLDFYGFSLNNTGNEAFQAFMWTCEYLLGSRGIDSGKTIVFYEDSSGMRAARGFWICEYLGHEDVHVLDGGMPAWKAAGGEVTTDNTEPPHAEFRGNPVPERHISAEEIRESLGREDFLVLDVRSEDEYYGRKVRAARGGAIPGAIHVEWTRNLDDRGAFKSAGELKDLYEGAGVLPGKEIACHCQGGYRSANTYLALRLLGYPKVRNYIGSWKEWGDRMDLPVEMPRPKTRET